MIPPYEHSNRKGFLIISADMYRNPETMVYTAFLHKLMLTIAMEYQPADHTIRITGYSKFFDELQVNEPTPGYKAEFVLDPETGYTTIKHALLTRTTPIPGALQSVPLNTFKFSEN